MSVGGVGGSLSAVLEKSVTPRGPPSVIATVVAAEHYSKTVSIKDYPANKVQRADIVSSEKITPPSVTLSRRLQGNVPTTHERLASAFAGNTAEERPCPRQILFHAVATTPVETKQLQPEAASVGPGDQLLEVFSPPGKGREHRDSVVATANGEDKRRLKGTMARSAVTRTRGETRMSSPQEQRGRSAKRKTNVVTSRRNKSATRRKGSAGISRSPLVGSRMATRRAASKTQTRKREEATAAEGSSKTEKDANDTPREAQQSSQGFPAISAAERVVAEYERLLEAMPTLTRYMGRLHEETAAMTEGLEKRVHDLVTGYRELNDLAEQAPLCVARAASDYSQALGCHPPASTSSNKGYGETLKVEAIHRELFALKEAKIALDKAVDLSSHLHRTPDGLDGKNVKQRGTNGAKRRPLYQPAIPRGGARTGNRSETAGSEMAAVATTEKRGNVVGRRVPEVFSGRPRGSTSRRRVLMEVQIDPDLPLPLPSFPGYRKCFSSHDALDVDRVSTKNANVAGEARENAAGLDVMDGKRKTSHKHNGVFLRGAVAPRQRQSHSLPQELRAISTTPTPERWSGRVPIGTGGRRRQRQHSTTRTPRVDTVSGHTGHHRASDSPPPPPPIPARRDHSTRDVTVGDAGGTHGMMRRNGVGVPGSTAATAAAREQRRSTSKALEELRKEMRDREDRLMEELGKFRRERAQLVQFSGANNTASGAKAGPDSAAVGLQSSPQNPVKGRLTASDKRRKLLASSSRRYNPASTYRKSLASNAAILRSRNAKNRGKGISSPLAPERASFGAQTSNDRLSRDTAANAGKNGRSVKHERERDTAATMTRDAAGPIRTADAQEQTVTEGVHVFLPPAPSLGTVMRTTEAGDDRSGVKSSGSRVATLDNNGLYSVDGGERGIGVQAVDHHDAALISTEPGFLSASIPPPPVVYVEGEGRNIAWRPSDDDCLLGARGAGRDFRGLAAGTGNGVSGMNGSNVPGRSEAMREILPGENCTEEARLVIASRLQNDEKDELDAGDMEVEGGDKIRQGENETDSRSWETSLHPSRDSDAKAPRTIRLTTGRFQRSPSNFPLAAPDHGNDHRVELAGMLGLVAANAGPVLPKAVQRSADIGPAESRDTDEVVVEESLSSSAVTRELMELMRAVVGQQRELGEERTSLMQALRAEMESRRALLANQQRSLQERETALDRRESESAAVGAYERDANAQHTAEIGDRRKRQQQEHEQQIERMDNDIESADADGDENEDSNQLQRGSGHVAEEPTSKVPAEARHAFRSNLGRMLAGGSSWTNLSLDAAHAPGKAFATSLGRSLAGGSAWQQLPLRDEDSAKEEPISGSLPLPLADPCFQTKQSATDVSARDHENDVQELLWKASRQGELNTADDTSLLSPDTAARTRASLLEWRRFSAAATEDNQRRLLEEGDGDDSSSGGSDEMATETTEAFVQTEAQGEAGMQANVASLIPPASSASQGRVASARSGGLELSLATAVLAVAQRLGDIEARSAVRVEDAEDAVNQALEDIRKEGEGNRQQQLEVMSRLQQTMQGSQETVQAVARELAKLREEARLARGRTPKVEVSPTPPPLLPPRNPQTASSSPGHSWIGSSGSESISSSRMVNASFVSGVALENIMAQTGQVPNTGPMSASRSSISEGQIQGGSFSDGELVNLTPRGTHAVEEGELRPSAPPASGVPPAAHVERTSSPRFSWQGAPNAQATVDREMNGGDVRGPASSFLREGDVQHVETGWTGGHVQETAANLASDRSGGDRRCTNRPSRPAGIDSQGHVAVPEQAERSGSKPFVAGGDDYEGKSSDQEAQKKSKNGSTFWQETRRLFSSHDGIFSTSSDSDASSSSLEPGQANPVERVPQYRSTAQANRKNVQPPCAGDGHEGRGRHEIGAWYRRSLRRHSSDKAPLSSSSGGEVSSGAECGQIPDSSLRSASDSDLRSVSEGYSASKPRILEAESQEATGTEQRKTVREGRNGAAVSRPLVRLRRMGMTASGVPDPTADRQHRKEVDRAVAEAELDLHSDLTAWRTREQMSKDISLLQT